jgi:hypothetical protein
VAKYGKIMAKYRRIEEMAKIKYRKEKLERNVEMKAKNQAAKIMKMNK